MEPSQEISPDLAAPPAFGLLSDSRHSASLQEHSNSAIAPSPVHGCHSMGAAAAMSAAPTLLEPGLVAACLSKKDSVAGKVRIKKQKPPPKNDAVATAVPDSPVLNAIDSTLRITFPSGRPLEDAPAVVQCKHCKKPMLRSVAKAHIMVCLQKKNEKAQKKKEQKEANRKAREAREKAERAAEDAAAAAAAAAAEEDDDESVNGDKGVKTAKGGAAAANASKKRKADGEGDKAPTKKKTKKELEAANKPKGAKPKGPVDVEKQCGVILANGQMCARSLTCKSHAMGAKRAVPGRSQRYDLLLAAYQKKNQAKQQKAAIDANAPLLDDAADATGPVDSDEEKELVMAAIARSRPRPLATCAFVPVRRKAQYLRVREMLSNALRPSGGGGGGGSSTSSGGGGMFGTGGGSAGTAAAAAAGPPGAGPAGEGSSGEPRRMSFAQQAGQQRGSVSATAGTSTSRKPSATGAPAAIAT